MSIDLSRLLAQAFFDEEVQNGAEAIERALEKYEQQTHVGARPFEVVAPSDPDETWVRDRLAHPLVYFCESEGTPVPKCSGVILALFVGSHLYGVPAERAIRWAGEALRMTVDELREQFGTHEIGTALR